MPTRDEVIREVLDAAATFVTNTDPQLPNTSATLVVEVADWLRLKSAVEDYLKSEEE